MNQRIRNILYGLKKRRGVKIILQWLTSRSTNYATGVITPVYDTLVIRKAIILPDEWTREGERITRDESVRRIVIDKKDLSGLEIKLDYVVFINNKRFEIQKIEAAEFDSAFMIWVKELKGQPTNQKRTVNVSQAMEIEHDISSQ
jgi:hypothetical protein